MDLQISEQNVVPIHFVNVDIFHRIMENFDLMVILEKVGKSPKSDRFILRGT